MKVVGGVGTTVLQPSLESFLAFCIMIKVVTYKGGRGGFDLCQNKCLANYLIYMTQVYTKVGDDA